MTRLIEQKAYFKTKCAELQLTIKFLSDLYGFEYEECKNLDFMTEEMLKEESEEVEKQCQEYFANL